MNQIIGLTLAGLITGGSILAGAAMLRQPLITEPVSVTITNPTKEERCSAATADNLGKPDWMLPAECRDRRQPTWGTDAWRRTQ